MLWSRECPHHACSCCNRPHYDNAYFQVNEEFVKLSEAYFVTKYNVDTAENMLRVTLMEPRTAGKTIDVEHEKVVIKCLKMVSN